MLRIDRQPTPLCRRSHMKFVPRTRSANTDWAHYVKPHGNPKQQIGLKCNANMKRKALAARDYFRGHLRKMSANELSLHDSSDHCQALMWFFVKRCGATAKGHGKRAPERSSKYCLVCYLYLLRWTLLPLLPAPVAMEHSLPHSLSHSLSNSAAL